MGKEGTVHLGVEALEPGLTLSIQAAVLAAVDTSAEQEPQGCAQGEGGRAGIAGECLSEGSEALVFFGLCA
jgi:hypothetical protein